MLEQTVAKGADSLFNHGVLGTVCVLLLIGLVFAGLVIRALYQDIKALNAAAPADREKLVTAQQAAAQAADKVVDVLDEFRETLSAQTDAHGSLTRQIELSLAEFRHSINNIMAAVSGIAERLRDKERERSRDSDWDRDRENTRGRP